MMVAVDAMGLKPPNKFFWFSFFGGVVVFSYNRESFHCFFMESVAVVFHTTGKSLASPSAGRKDDSGSTLNTSFFTPSGDAGLMGCLGVLLCSAGFEIFSFVVTVLGGNYCALLCTVPPPPNPPGGSFLELPADLGNVAAVAVGSVGAAGLRRG